MALHRRMGLQMSSFPPNNAAPIKVAFQGESGAYSEKATREMLGSRVTTVPCKSFEDTFKAVASREADYAVLPIENSLGGSIHINYDLLLRYDLHIIGEHEFRVEHSLLALPGVKREDIVKVMSHPQALAQCDNYLRSWGVKREEAYDTAGSAKMIADNNLRDCAAIASGGPPSSYPTVIFLIPCFYPAVIFLIPCFYPTVITPIPPSYFTIITLIYMTNLSSLCIRCHVAVCICVSTDLVVYLNTLSKHHEQIWLVSLMVSKYLTPTSKTGTTILPGFCCYLAIL